MQAPGVALRDQQVELFVTAQRAAAANESQRSRLVSTLRTLDESQWRTSSRCPDWTVQDVVRHLAQMADLTRAALTGGRAGERVDAFTTFDPKKTPTDLVRSVGTQAPASTLADFERSTAALIELVNGLGPEETFLAVTPAGRQPWPRSTLHALFDSAVHERDIAAPLGINVPAGEKEMTAIAAYQVLLSSRVACMFGAQARFELELTGASGMTVTIDGPNVRLSDQLGSGATVCSGDAVRVLDAMTGRGDLSAELHAPPEVIAVLSTLVALI